ncbi:neurexin-4-like isoform X2 [Littorina saxatilis]|uniref:Neurexin-4 n=1 Tax=Littorina saxatilis TaxID=31220 RepID=A0AAN9G266_9CAEN
MISRLIQWLLPAAALLCLTVAQQDIFEESVHEYEDCRGQYQQPVGIASGAIPNSAMTASTSLTKREPWNARLYDTAGAWSPKVQNAYEWLQIDFGRQFIITKLHTQGRRGSDEYVSEFFLEFSDDSTTWKRYTNRFGIAEMFVGNHDDSSEQIITLVYPIVTKFVRFNPQRWNMVISMRVDLTGCPYTAYTSNFLGGGYIQYDLSQQAVQTTTDLVELRFKTNSPHGVLFYASGNQGDFMVLQMNRGYLNFTIDLGSTQTERGITEVTAGSLLDDDQWHDVIIMRENKKLKVVVDRLVNQLETNGLFYRLDLDKYIDIGGVEHFMQDGIKVKYNFNGCIQNVNFNGARLLQDANSADRISSITVHGDVGTYCGSTAATPVTFPTLEAHLQIEATSSTGIQADLEFRTHDEDGLLVYHPMSQDDSGLTVMIDSDGYIAYKIVSMSGQIIEDVVRNNDVTRMSDGFADGLWHHLHIEVTDRKVNCTVDRNVKVSDRQLSITPATMYYVGGNELFNGFRGCMRNIFVAGRVVDLEDVFLTAGVNIGANVGTCAIRDRCTPNPCRHGGLCTQSWNTFSCDCQSTGYKGEMCHISAHHVSCQMHKQYSNVEGTEIAIIDPDGSGPLPPFEVSCDKDDGNSIMTSIGHDSEEMITVNGFQDPGSYVRLIKYATDDMEALEDIIERADTCRQYIEYRCNSSKLLAPIGGDGTDQVAKTYGWWVGRTYQPMYYWGGAAPGSMKCACGLEEKGCVGSSTTCNCDAGLPTQTSDRGYLVHKNYLPVLELHFGDTGVVTDNKLARHKLGKLECFGDDLFDNTVTFNMADAVLEFPTFEANIAGDIWFQFKTTTTDGVMVHCTGDTDFIEVRLLQSDTIQFRYDVGNGVNVLPFRSPAPLNDDRWHTIHIEKNRKQAWMRIDDFTEVTKNEDADLIRLLDLKTPLFIGALIDYNDGYVGCMRGLRVNGKLMDMSGFLRSGEVYGVVRGCIGKCASNPCFNGGTCREGYSRYTCECSYTPWRGWNCGREVGVNLKKNYMVRYTFDETQGLSATDFQYATIGFSTKVKQGILMQLKSVETPDYISVEMNNNGGVKVVLDVGFQREEVNTPNIGIDFANTQVHVVTVRRSDKGRRIFVQVDNYPPVDHYFQVSDQSDTILDKPKFLYVGNNDTAETNYGFEGCIYRMQVDNIFPLKRAFQDPRPAYISLLPEGAVREDMCGFEEVTVVPEPIKTRPNRGELQNVTYPHAEAKELSPEERAIIAVSVTAFFLLVIIILIFVFRSRLEGGDYETEEATGAEYADDPDTAIVYNQTGLPNMTTKYEFFM